MNDNDAEKTSSSGVVETVDLAITAGGS